MKAKTRKSSRRSLVEIATGRAPTDRSESILALLNQPGWRICFNSEMSGAVTSYAMTLREAAEQVGCWIIDGELEISLIPPAVESEVRS
jgi:hypothetical protein